MPAETSNEITISGTGASISADGMKSTYQLKVETNDPTARIVVLDGRFTPVAKANGSITKELPAGIYKVRVQRGASSIGFEDRLVVLDRKTEVSIVPPRLSTPSPLGGTNAGDAHVAACEWLDAVVHADLGRGSKLAVLARYAEPQQGKSALHPFRGLHVLRANGERLVDLEKVAPQVHLPDSQEPISICGISVDPGSYILRYSLASNRQVSQSLIASTGWQTTINIRRVQASSPTERAVPNVPTASAAAPDALFSQPGYVSILMRQLADWQSVERAPQRVSPDGPIDDDRLIEIARQGLADGIQLLSGNLYDLMLREFENPLVGILGGLLLDVERDAQGKDFPKEHQELFDPAVAKLRKMVGTAHPDVEALSFRCQDPSAAHKKAIRARPMFYRSWRMILEAAATRSDLLPLDLWKRTSASGSMPPFLIWTADRTYKLNRLKKLKRTISELFNPEGAYDRSTKNKSNPATEAVMAVAAVTAPASARTATRPTLHEIALEMGMPANAVERLAAGPKASMSPRRRPSSPKPSRG